MDNMKKALKIFIAAFTLLLSFSGLAQNPRLAPLVDAIKFRVTTTGIRDQYVVPANQAWLIYNTTTAQLEYWDGDSWEAGGTGGGSGPTYTAGTGLTLSIGNEFSVTTPFTSAIQAQIDANTGKVGITAQQAADIIANNAKISYTGDSDTSATNEIQTAAEVNVTDTGNNYTSTSVEDILAEIAPQLVDLSANYTWTGFHEFQGASSRFIGFDVNQTGIAGINFQANNVGQFQFDFDNDTQNFRLFHTSTGGSTLTFPQNGVATISNYTLAEQQAAPNNGIVLKEYIDNEISGVSSGGATQLSDLTDVGGSTPTVGNVLRGTGTNFVSGKLNFSDLQGEVQVTTQIADGVISYGKLISTPESTILGRRSGEGAGQPVGMTAAEARTVLNIEDNAAADQNAAEVAYDNTISGLVATNVKSAVDELENEIDNIAANGTGIVAEGNISLTPSAATTVTHGLGYTPDIQRISVIFSAAASVGTGPVISNVTSTTFDIAMGSATGVTAYWAVFGADTATPLSGSEVVTAINTELGNTSWQSSGGSGIQSEASPPTGWEVITGIYYNDYEVNSSPAALPTGYKGLVDNLPVAETHDATMDGAEHRQKLVYDDRTADIATITFSNLELGQEIIIYYNRASLPTFSGATIKEMPNTEGFQANTELVFYGFVNPDGEIDGVYKEITP